MADIDNKLEFWGAEQNKEKKKELIRGNRLNQFFRSYEKSKGNCEYTDTFFEMILQPEYKMLILLYYSLCAVSGIKVKKE